MEFPNAPTTPLKFPKELKILAVEFCSNSSIHGVKYFVRKQQLLIEKVWWITVFLVSLVSCSSMIRAVYNKWNREPVIVTFDEQTTPVFDVPFPAITICPEMKTSSTVFNFSEAYEEFRSAPEGGLKDENRLDKFLALWQICDMAEETIFPERIRDNKCAELIQELAIPVEDIFKQCIWRYKEIDCAKEFKPIITDVGLCYTFNSLIVSGLERISNLSLQGRAEGPPKNVEWTLDRGFKHPTKIDTYPRRVLGPGKKSGMIVVLRANINDMDFLCGNSIQGFKILIHSPADYPELQNQHLRLPLNQEIGLGVTPSLSYTTPTIIRYAPERRKCYFNNERFLKFYRTYTQSNCDLECLTNFTLTRCACVRFSMPRLEDTPICGVGKIQCYEQAYIDFLEMELKMLRKNDTNFRKACQCLPACSSIRYTAEISQADFEWWRMTRMCKTTVEARENIQMSYLVVFFRNAHFMAVKRAELYGITDFLANCGGLMGLFLGVSILNLVEIVYYCTVRPFMLVVLLDNDFGGHVLLGNAGGLLSMGRQSHGDDIRSCFDPHLEATVSGNYSLSSGESPFGGFRF
ncbi:pickpocket protein 28-like [Uranotaenia lowii]|uniref:pickpocket protein 28-like n=1 Tax=Uranotaenia lowii TaxID=190385 RepID=UPI002478F272|nr:pickpocket protein 28-like [Uranotaenia lowii]